MADDTKNTDSGTPQQPDAAPQPPRDAPDRAVASAATFYTGPAGSSRAAPAAATDVRRSAAQPQALPACSAHAQLTGGMVRLACGGRLAGIFRVSSSLGLERRQMPQVKSDALKFAIIGFVIWIVLQFIFGMIV